MNDSFELEILNYNNLYKIFNDFYYMRNLGLVVSIFFVLCFSLVSSFSVEPEYGENVYIKDFDTPINFTLQLNGLSDGYYQIYTLADVDLLPKGFFYLNKTKTRINISIQPLERAQNLENFAFTYVVHKQSGEKEEKTARIYTRNFEDVISVKSNYIDFEDGEVKVFVKNSVGVDFKNLTARFSSILFDFEETFDLNANETKIFDVDVDEDLFKKTKAGTYIIDAFFESLGGNKKITGNLYLNEQRGISTQENVGGFLIRSKTVSKFNVGNMIENVKIEIKKDIFSRLFTSFSEKPLFIFRDGLSVTYVWESRISPSELYSVKVRTNYLYPILIIGLLVAVYYFLKKFLEKKVDVKKTVTPLRTKHGEFALKVTLFVKAKRDLEEVVLIDRVPRTVKIYKKMMNPTPDEVDVTTRTMRWDIGDLDSGEERVFNYVVYSRVGYVGKFSLPSAHLDFVYDERALKENSNSVFFLNDQENIHIKKGV